MCYKSYQHYLIPHSLCICAELGLPGRIPKQADHRSSGVATPAAQLADPRPRRQRHRRPEEGRLLFSQRVLVVPDAVSFFSASEEGEEERRCIISSLSLIWWWNEERSSTVCYMWKGTWGSKKRRQKLSTRQPEARIKVTATWWIKSHKTNELRCN